MLLGCGTEVGGPPQECVVWVTPNQRYVSQSGTRFVHVKRCLFANSIRLTCIVVSTVVSDWSGNIFSKRNRE